MSAGDFVWCDLSAFNADRAREFYGRLLGWHFEEISQPDGTPYAIAFTSAGESAGIFDMPEPFQKMGLPSFWMSYVEVNDIRAAVERARERGGRVEFGPQAFGDNSSIALIRDPLGAGFTAYEGSDLSPRRRDAAFGHMTWNALYVSDAQAVIEFYASLFGWQISRDPSRLDRWIVRNARGEQIAAIEEQSDEMRGGYQYWGVHFAVRDAGEAMTTLSALGARVLAEEVTEAATVLAAQDVDGAAFYLVQSTPSQGLGVTDD